MLKILREFNINLLMSVVMCILATLGAGGMVLLDFVKDVEDKKMTLVALGVITFLIVGLLYIYCFL